MKTWQFVLLGLALLSTAGCRSDPAVAILERDLRCKEDEIYRLRAAVEELQDSVNSCPDRAGRAARSTAEGEREEAAPSHHNGVGEPSDGIPPQIELPPQPSEKVPNTLKGRYDSTPSGVPDVPKEIQGPSKPLGFGADGPTLDPQTERIGASRASKTSEPVAFAPAGDSRRVASIAINRMMSGGINSGDHSGDQGLLVVVEPRDRAGRSVDAPAEMSVVVLDPAILDARGKAARVARWDFTEGETAAMFRRTDSNGAMHLAMAWPAQGPKHGKLHVFVRYVTADGRRLEADGPIEVALPGEKTAGWTPAPPSAHADQSTEPPRTADSWRPSATPLTRSAGVPLAEPVPAAGSADPPLVATRPDPQRPELPAWTPDRR